MMNEGLLKRGRYNESKRRLYTISVTDKFWEVRIGSQQTMEYLHREVNA